MAMLRTLVIAVVAFSPVFAACARSSQPSASVSHVARTWLTGQWQANTWTFGAADPRFQRDTIVTFADDGTWNAAAGGSGTSLTVGDRVVMDGVSAEGDKLSLTLHQRQGSSGPELFGPMDWRGNSTELTLKKLR